MKSVMAIMAAQIGGDPRAPAHFILHLCAARTLFDRRRRCAASVAGGKHAASLNWRKIRQAHVFMRGFAGVGASAA
jgi:hypothetical protein